MQIGQEVQQTERAHQEGFSVSDLRSFLVQQETKIHGTQFSERKIHGSNSSCMWGYLDEEDSGWFVRFTFRSTLIHCDNQSCIKLSVNPVFHDRSKHIDIWYHHIRDCVQQKIMLLQYIPTEDQDVDILMKAFTKSKFEYHRGRIGVKDNPYLVERECWDSTRWWAQWKESPSLSGPAGYFWRKCIFRLCLFLDMMIIFQKLQDAIYGWLIKLEK